MKIKVTEQQMFDITSKNIDAGRYRGRDEVDGTRLDTALLMAIYKNMTEKDIIIVEHQ